MTLNLAIDSKLQNLKLLIVTVSSFYALLTTSIAQADFHKAILAYQNRDGLALLSEVKDAVNKKNNDGLMLFMNAMSIDRGTSTKTSLYKGSQDKKQTALENILTDQQRQELIELLISATNNSNADAQFYLTSAIRELDNPQLTATIKSNDEYAKSGSLVAANYSKLTDIEKAELGDPFAQMLLGLSYLRTVDYRKYGCDDSPDKPICRPRDETKGYYWLKQSLKNYEVKGHGDMGVYYNSMCDLLQAQDDPKQLKQAYLWCMLGINSNGQNDAWRLLRKMQESGKLKVVMPTLDSGFNSMNRQVRENIFPNLVSSTSELPDWVLETRQKLTKSDQPVFTYYVNDYMEYELDVYRNGRVNIAFGSTSNDLRGTEGNGSSFVDVKKDLFLKLPATKVRNFLADLRKTGFYGWSPVNNGVGFCDIPDSTGCVPKHYQVTVRNGVKINRFYYVGLAGYIEYKNEMNSKMAQLANLVEKYFPTKSLRCEQGVSEEFKQACLGREAKLLEVAQPILTNPKK